MSRWLDKLISELKWRSWYDYAWIQDKIAAMHKPPMPEPEEGIAVVEIEAVPEWECPACWKEHEWPCEEPKSWEAEEPKLPEEVDNEPANDEAPFEDTTEEKEALEWEDKLEEPTPAEEDRMQEILKAIKTFFPNENTEDVLVRLVQKLIDL